MTDQSEQDAKDAQAYVDKEFIESPLSPENEVYADIAERAFLAGRKRDDPTDDEREALTTVAAIVWRDAYGTPTDEDFAEAILAAGFRRSEVPKSSNECCDVLGGPERCGDCPQDREEPQGEPKHDEPRGDLEICQCYRDGSELVTCARHAKPQDEPSDALAGWDIAGMVAGLRAAADSPRDQVAITRQRLVEAAEALEISRAALRAAWKEGIK